MKAVQFLRSNGTAIRSLCLMAILMAACTGPTEPDYEPMELEFSKMEIHYSVMGSWYNPQFMDIDSSGAVSAVYYGGMSQDTLAVGTSQLSEADMERLADMFGLFWTYQPNYEPQAYEKAKDYHETILIYEGVEYKVRVLMPNDAWVPKGMRAILDEMRKMWNGMIE